MYLELLISMFEVIVPIALACLLVRNVTVRNIQPHVVLKSTYEYMQREANIASSSAMIQHGRDVRELNSKIVSIQSYKNGEIRQLKDKIEQQKNQIDGLVKYSASIVADKIKNGPMSNELEQLKLAKIKAKEYKKTAIQCARVIKVLSARIKELNNA